MLHELLSAGVSEFDGSPSLYGLASNLTYSYNNLTFLSTNTFSYLQASKYALAAATALWSYDFLLTFESELELFWKQIDRSVVNTLYLMVSSLAFLYCE